MNHSTEHSKVWAVKPNMSKTISKKDINTGVYDPRERDMLFEKIIKKKVIVYSRHWFSSAKSLGDRIQIRNKHAAYVLFFSHSFSFKWNNLHMRTLFCSVESQKFILLWLRFWNDVGKGNENSFVWIQNDSICWMNTLMQLIFKKL